MRCIVPYKHARAHRLPPRRLGPAPVSVYGSVRQFAKAQQPDDTRSGGGGWFSASTPRPLPSEHKGEGGKPPNERTLRLGQTIRILHERLPTLMVSPLPQDILSPHITLHLFPSTLPHLPTVSGRIAYTAALWTAPVAWGRVPVVGNVRLEVLSERMMRNGSGSTSAEEANEELIVKWRTCGKAKGKGVGALYHGFSGTGQRERDRMAGFLSGSDEGGGGDASGDEEFVGMFIFGFDDDGRMLTHTIENVEGGNWDKMARVISVTDWLLGKAWGAKQPAGLALGFCKSDEDSYRRPPPPPPPRVQSR